MHRVTNHWQLIGITGLVFLLWNTPVVLPLKLLVVFMHEVAHGLAAVLTGGQIETISLSAQQGGYAVTRGGNAFITISAGYLGSLLIGVALLLAALQTRADRVVLGLFGAVTLCVTALYIREIFPFVFCTVTGLGMLTAAIYLDRAVSDMVLRVIGLASVIYVPYDIFDDTIARPGVRSDAYMLSEQFGGPVVFWGGLWLLISVAVIVLTLRYALSQNSNLKFARPPERDGRASRSNS